MNLNMLFNYRRKRGAFQAKMILLQCSRFVVLSIAVFLGLVVLPYRNCAEAVIYSGNGRDLKSPPTWFTSSSSLSFFSGTTDNPVMSGNNLTIDYDNTAPGITRPANAFGGLSDVYDVQNNRLNLINGTVTGYVYGGWSKDGNTVNNVVNINGGSVGMRVYGGYSANNGNSTNNIVAVNGGSVDNVVIGGYSLIGNAVDNNVIINGGSVSRWVYGGYSVSGDTVDNSVSITGGYIGQNIYGARSERGNATGNKLTISGGTIVQDAMGAVSNFKNSVNNIVTMGSGFVGRDIVGGLSETGAVEGNEVIVEGTSTVGRNVYGGFNQFGTTENNRVTISGGTISNDVYGGLSNLGTTTKNIVIISSGTILNDILGGKSDKDATGNSVVFSGGFVGEDIVGGWSISNVSINNSVAISGGTVSNAVFGGLGVEGAEGNFVLITGGTVGGTAYGGYAQGSSGIAAGNTITVTKDGLVSKNVYGGVGPGGSTDNDVFVSGGRIDGNIYGGWSNSGSAEKNAVYISNGDVNGLVNGGKSVDGDAINNIVSISGGSVKRQVYGGYSDNGSATDNVFTISGGIVGNNVYGGRGYVNAKNNSITISGGTVDGYVYGGSSSSGNSVNNAVTIISGDIGYAVHGGYSSNGDASYNTVTISGGNVDGNVFGGYSGQGDATYNTVTIVGQPVFSANAGIRGGHVDSVAGNAFTGNTLNFKSSGISVASVANFQYYNFFLPNGTAANDTMLYVADTVDIAGTTVDVLLQGDIALQTGDRVALINNNTYNFTTSPLNDSSKAWLGAFIKYDFDIYTENNNLWAELTSVTTSKQSDILTDSRLAPLAFLNQGTDMVASLELLEVSGDRRFNTFAVMGGGSSTYDTGMQADIDVDGVSMLAGVMWDVPIDKNRLIMSAFFEAGWGSYDTYREFGSANVIRGDGDTNYYGGGLYMCYKRDSNIHGGFYADVSLRIGYTTSDFNTNDLTSVSNFRYDSGSTYYGGHVGLGYVWHLDSKNRLEATSKYLWTHLSSDEVTTSAGDKVNFNSVNSHRWRTGFRLYHDIETARVLTLYYGVAYEYEFDGDANARLRGLSLDGSSLSGGSCVGELGVIFMPSKDNDQLLMRLGIQGYLGAREGVSGILTLQYSF